MDTSVTAVRTCDPVVRIIAVTDLGATVTSLYAKFCVANLKEKDH
jgi:hypothetical protein